ncbi:MAG TPA: hypothetical protein VFP21_09635 [Solirubrobacterales bacterium]|nr:hypothetical protein [Solirubrobacterales bacterium]
MLPVLAGINRQMESFEQVCRVALEAEGYAVSGNVKFFVRRKTNKQSRDEYQTHGYEIDLLGAKGGSLVLAEVKSFLGSTGVSTAGFVGITGATTKASKASLFKLFNDADLRKKVLAEARKRYGYKAGEIEMRLYVGKFRKGHEEAVRNHLATFRRPPVRVIALEEIVEQLLKQAASKSYLDDPVLVTVKALAAADRIKRD